MPCGVRARKDKREVESPTLAKLQNQGVLDEQMRQRLVLGVSTRNYEHVINGYSEKLGVSRSSVSRAFVQASQKDLDSINEGKLCDHGFVALLIDSLEVGGRTVVAALGSTAEMEKIPVGLREGDTENSEVVKDLLASLQDRGVTLHCERLLAVIDGTQALKKALRQVFGTDATLSKPNGEWDNFPKVLRDLVKRGLQTPVTITTDSAARLTEATAARRCGFAVGSPKCKSCSKKCPHKPGPSSRRW